MKGPDCGNTGRVLFVRLGVGRAGVCGMVRLGAGGCSAWSSPLWTAWCVGPNEGISLATMDTAADHCGHNGREVGT
jgi:hypothetical protein